MTIFSFKKNTLATEKLVFFRETESEARGFSCSVDVTAHCYKLFLSYEKEETPGWHNKKSTLLLSRTHEPNLQSEPKLFSFQFP